MPVPEDLFWHRDLAPSLRLGLARRMCTRTRHATGPLRGDVRAPESELRSAQEWQGSAALSLGRSLRGPQDQAPGPRCRGLRCQSPIARTLCALSGSSLQGPPPTQCQLQKRARRRPISTLASFAWSCITLGSHGPAFGPRDKPGSDLTVETRTGPHALGNCIYSRSLRD